MPNIMARSPLLGCFDPLMIFGRSPHPVTNSRLREISKISLWYGGMMPRSELLRRSSAQDVSAHPHQSVRILLPAPHVDIGAGADHRRGFFVECTDDARGRANNQ